MNKKNIFFESSNDEFNYLDYAEKIGENLSQYKKDLNLLRNQLDLVKSKFTDKPLYLIFNLNRNLKRNNKKINIFKELYKNINIGKPIPQMKSKLASNFNLNLTYTFNSNSAFASKTFSKNNSKTKSKIKTKLQLTFNPSFSKNYTQDRFMMIKEKFSHEENPDYSNNIVNICTNKNNNYKRYSNNSFNIKYNLNNNKTNHMKSSLNFNGNEKNIKNNYTKHYTSLRRFFNNTSLKVKRFPNIREQKIQEIRNLFKIKCDKTKIHSSKVDNAISDDLNFKMSKFDSWIQLIDNCIIREHNNRSTSK